MTDDTKTNARVLAAGTERMAPQAGDARSSRRDAVDAANAPVGRNGARALGNGFWRVAVLVAGCAAYGCVDSTSKPEEDTDAAVVDVEDADHDVPAEADADVAPPEADMAEDGDVTEHDGDAAEAESDGPVETDMDSCPTTEPVTETPDAPPINGIDQSITETYDVITECDGSETRLLNTSTDNFSRPASRTDTDAAIADGSETVMFGETVRITKLRVGIVEFAPHLGIDGAEATVVPLGSVSDGAHTVMARSIVDGNVSLEIYDSGGAMIDSASLSGGQYYILPSGNIAMVTRINFNRVDPLRSTCDLAILGPPVLGHDGGTITHEGRPYTVSEPNDGANVSGIGLERVAL